MTSIAKLKLIPRSTLKAKGATRLVGQVTAGNGVIVTKDAGNFEVALSGGVVQTVIDDTNVTGDITSGALTLGWSGVLSQERGGAGSGVLGSMFTGAGVGTASSYSLFANAGAAINRTWQDKGRDIVSIKDYAACAGSGDDRAGLLAAFAALPLGGTVYIPAYCVVRLSAAVTVPAGIHIVGVSAHHSIIQTTSATANVLNCAGGFNQIRNLTISSSVARTAGVYINISGATTYLLHNLVLAAPFEGVNIDAGNVVLDTVQIIETVASTGIGLRLKGGLALSIINPYLQSAGCFANIFAEKFGDLTIIGGHIVGATSNFYIAPGTGQLCAFLKCVGVTFDTAVTNAVNVAPSGTGTAVNLNFYGCTFGSNQSSLGQLLNLSPGGTATISGVHLVGCSLANAQLGIFADNGSGTVEGLIVEGGDIEGCTIAAVKLTDVDGASFNGTRIGPWAGNALNALGIWLLGTTDNVYINNCDVTGNTTAYTSTSSGTNINIDINSPGLTPTAQSAPLWLVTANGALATPSIARSTDLNTGVWFPGADQMALVAGGVNKVSMNATGVGINVAVGTIDTPLFVGGTSPGNAIMSHFSSSAGAMVQFTDAGSKDWAYGVADGSTSLTFYEDRNVSSAGTLRLELKAGGEVSAPGALKSSGATSGVGYGTGAGGTVTQATDKSTGVTLNKVSGAITMNNASLANSTTVNFTVTNSAVAATDVVIVNHSSAGTAGAYVITVTTVGAGSFVISVRNVSGGSLGEAIVLNFAVIKGVAA